MSVISSFINFVFKIVLLPVWALILPLWWVSVLLSAPWRMLFYGDSFHGKISNFQEHHIGFFRGLGMMLLIPYTLPTSIFYSIMVALSSPFRQWILGGVGPGSSNELRKRGIES